MPECQAVVDLLYNNTTYNCSNPQKSMQRNVFFPVQSVYHRITR